MNINLQIIDEVVSALPRDTEDNREQVNHLIGNHHRAFTGHNDISQLRNMSVEQQLMLLYYWAADGYRNGDLTRDQLDLLHNPLRTIKKRLLKEDKECLTHKLWNRAIRSDTRDEPMREEEAILRALEPAADLAALQEALGEAVADDYSERVPVEDE